VLPSIAALATFAVWHLRRTGFWYDESMQFWMSLGLDGFGPPHARPGGLKDVIRQNAIGNLDPGGFTIVLWIWLKLATGEIWQRMLPFVFFMFGMGCFGWLGWNLRRSIPFAALSCAVPAGYPLLLDYATEVRAYSMEFAGIALGCILLDRVVPRPDTRPALLAGVIFAAFLSSRYSYALFTAAAFSALAIATYANPSLSRRQAFARLAAFAVPLFIAAALIFAAAFLPQYIRRMSPENGAYLQYFAATTAAGKSWNQLLTMLARNLFGPAGLPLTLAALLGAARLVPRRWWTWLGLKRLSQDHVMFGTLALGAIFLSALVWRWHPWDMSQKWSLWLHGLSAVALVRVAACVLGLVAAPPLASGRESDLRVTAVMIVGAMAIDMCLALHHRVGDTVAPALAYLERIQPAAGTVAVDIYWYPTVRYFYEYGAYAGSSLYPQAFRFPNWTGPKPLISSETRFLVTPRTLGEARSYFKGYKITDDPALPPQIFRVEPMTALTTNSIG
jgi:hypothetical protein